MNTTNSTSPPSLLGPFRGFSHGWSRYAEFRGRSSRVEFWSFTIINLFVLFLLYAVSVMVSGVIDSLMMLIPVVTHQLVMFIPAISVWVRRLHDIGTSGWWVFWAIFSWVIGIVLVIATIFDTASDVFGKFKVPEPIQNILSLAIGAPAVALAIVFAIVLVNFLPVVICYLVGSLFFVLIIYGAFGKETDVIPDNVDSLPGEAELAPVILSLVIMSVVVMVNFTSVVMCFVDGDPGTNEYGPNPKLNPANPNHPVLQPPPPPPPPSPTG